MEIKKLADTQVPEKLEVIENLTKAYKSFQVLRTAIDSGLFDWLEKTGGSTREELSAGVKLHGLFMKGYLESLVELGFLVQSGNQYTNSALASCLLTSDKETYQGEWLSLTAKSDWSDLLSLFRSQNPVSALYHDSDFPEYIQALAKRPLTGELQAVTRHVAGWPGFRQSRKILDIGGSFGLFTLALCQENHGLEGLILEEPLRVAHTFKLIEDQGLADRVKVQACNNLLEIELEPDFDVILMVHQLYAYRQQLSPLFSKMSNLLNPGGLLVSNHWFCGPGCEVESGGINELDKAIHSFGHPICHVEHFGRFFTESGVKLLSKADVPSTYGVSKLHLGQKEGRIQINL
ncbi:class I SAM-dependent methyltransferase [Desulfosporosinus sp. PR]|uniref:class I SAM-dependent methyltransferase n=1 Tax=Candidatus Desulfosporosinus nitrosoreducens TaxID=3401928 RepID=UPI0027F53969|nr:class I SAM-dependent methyltransferase [Desulfosporosinus sp. PR]MDQ7095681.1 class I SAM-dependent methyltransferase [Desulfosporosinus sp. PR]